MSYFVRVFSQSDDYVSLSSLCDTLLEEEFEFATDPGKDTDAFRESSWDFVALQYDIEQPHIELEYNKKTDNGDMFRIEQEEFLSVIKDLPYSKGQKKAKEIVKNAVQIFAFDCDDAMGEDGWEFLECLLEHLCDATDGYVQVDQEGIYDKNGELLIEME